MSRRTIRISLNVPSINHAIHALEYEKRRLNRKKDEFFDRLGEKAVKELRQIYNGKANVDYEVGDGLVVIKADGEGMLFVEFGAGVPADSTQGVRFNFGAGSYSLTHAQTYQEWLASGGTKWSVDGHYVYDREGLDAFMQLENKLHDIIRETADEVFGK